ncbi:hypothetical protein [Neodiprion abietis nucleopolyhedrovirus]|uniref:Uncharacterized protein n=1 Tax=Neodiprion abietis nucleopolyhedrovirus TaxID=204507 RepID=Q0ZP75_9CBAC|nr:hypothetical protein [Neodiprion abietis nucleopolyhedrovirus]ABC74879.1 unknown [Neodiprion abietis nucleopolyhedrovirus]
MGIYLILVVLYVSVLCDAKRFLLGKPVTKSIFDPPQTSAIVDNSYQHINAVNNTQNKNNQGLNPQILLSNHVSGTNITYGSNTSLATNSDESIYNITADLAELYNNETSTELFPMHELIRNFNILIVLINKIHELDLSIDNYQTEIKLLTRTHFKDDVKHDMKIQLSKYSDEKKLLTKLIVKRIKKYKQRTSFNERNFGLTDRYRTYLHYDFCHRQDLIRLCN